MSCKFIPSRDTKGVQADRSRALRFLSLLLPAVLLAHPQQATVEDTGSTNRAGLSVTFDREGHATVNPRNGEPQHVTLPEPLCKRFMQNLEAAGPLTELPAVRCVKSVSFGSRTFVEFNGGRSPDLSCPSSDARSQLLQRDANEVLQAAREAANIPSGRRVFTVPAPHAQ